ncbi:prolyl-tRNA synthetase [Streptosporangium becharense]|uniref:Prolyl-tRNA synthetase n=1 Tax=Streptosporangium becharense TaxID=1816182 RepID=A0A7W9MI55_9ACTN|nr:aminoacyl--tRNA ligase-related protein [Streptosporangium becharense]MBB2911307.1 prolyl-tRNA synthetase [Streptosporangium becharense]MBB5821635.1 prolyl-tRNA synthetase [Streptosporangium becharense]
MGITVLRSDPWLWPSFSDFSSGTLDRSRLEALIADKSIGAGLLTWSPVGLRIREALCDRLRYEIAAAHFQEIEFPLLLPPELSLEVERLRPHQHQMYRAQAPISGVVGLGATYEETFEHWIAGRGLFTRDEIRLFQIGPKFRHVDSPKRLIRLRQFIMCDLYASARTREDLRKIHAEVEGTFERFLDWMGIPYARVEVLERDLAYVQFVVHDAGGEERLDERGVSIRASESFGDLRDVGRTSTVAMYMEVATSRQEEHAIAGSYGWGIERLINLVLDRACGTGFRSMPGPLRPFQFAVLAHPSLSRDEISGLRDVLGRTLSGDVACLLDDAVRQSFGMREDRAVALGCDLVVVIGKRELEEGTAIVVRSPLDGPQTVSLGDLPGMLSGNGM